MGGIAAVLYGGLVYLLSLGTFVYAIAFVGNLPVPHTIDGGLAQPLVPALPTDVMLLGLCAAQYSVSHWWRRLVPKPLEQTTCSLGVSLALLLLFRHWQPMPHAVWTVTHPASAAFLVVVAWLGWGVTLLSTFLIDHWELFGLRQVYARLRGWTLPLPVFRTPFLYQHVRHPVYCGVLLAIWSTPRMTVGHLLFSVTITGYVLVAIHCEERDLLAAFGEPYRRYREQVPMLLPLGTRQYDDMPVHAPPVDLRWP